MASHTLRVGERFPAGTVVGAYIRHSYEGDPPSVPLSAPVETQIVSDLGELTFITVLQGEAYWAGAQVDGPWRWVDFRVAGTPSLTLASTDLLDSDDLVRQADLDVALTGTIGDPAYGTNWAAAAGTLAPSYAQVGPVVHLYGTAAKSTAPADGDAIFTLPVGQRPAGQQEYTTYTIQSGVRAAGWVRLTTAGEVQWINGTGAVGSKIGLDGINFRAVT